jgi:hypothetical protein
MSNPFILAKDKNMKKMIFAAALLLIAHPASATDASVESARNNFKQQKQEAVAAHKALREAKAKQRLERATKLEEKAATMKAKAQEHADKVGTE